MEDKAVKPVICPYCCRRFHPNEADFRLVTPVSEKSGSKSRKKKTDGVTGKSFDAKLFAYNRDILQNDEEESNRNALQFLPVNVITCPDLKFDEGDLAKYGFITRVTYTAPDGREHTTEKRICPGCHNDLPIGYGLRETLLISILGDARSGKSIFLTVLINELENNRDMTSKLTFIGDKKVGDDFVLNYHKPLYKDHELIRSTKRKKMPPFAYNYWYRYKDENGAEKENAVDLIFYDIAGEDLRDGDAIRQNGFNIRDSSGLIFLADPTNFTKLGDLFRVTDNALVDAIPEDNSSQNIFNTLYNYFLGLEKEKSDIPFAMVLSKSDLFKYVSLEYFEDKPDNRIQNLLEDEAHSFGVNMRSVRGLNSEVRELLEFAGERAVLNNALGCFKSVSCFAISSLGKKPVVEQISDPETNEPIERGFVDDPLEPFRVKEAFYWILMKNKLLCQYDNGRYIANGAAPAVKKTWFENIKEWVTGVFAKGRKPRP